MFHLLNHLAAISLTLAPTPTCENGYRSNEEEIAPIQRVGSYRSPQDLKLPWSRPTDNYQRISSFLGETYQLAKHEGSDYINSDPSIPEIPIFAVAEGKVVYIRRGCPQSSLVERNTDLRECGAGWGNHIVIAHPNGLFTRYTHLHPGSIEVRVGQQVEHQQYLAIMGNSGRSNTRHLHFELGIATTFKSCEPAQSFLYIYDPETHLGWTKLDFRAIAPFGTTIERGDR